MNARQRRKDRRAHPERYWTQAEIDEIKAHAAWMRALLNGDAAPVIAESK